MRKLLLLLCLLPCFALAQTTYWSPGIPPSSTSFSPTFRFLGTDSLASYYLNNSNRWNQVYTATQSNLRFLKISDSSNYQTVANFFPKGDARYQKILTAGTNITITGNVISATGGSSITASNGVVDSSGVIQLSDGVSGLINKSTKLQDADNTVLVWLSPGASSPKVALSATSTSGAHSGYSGNLTVTGAAATFSYGASSLEQLQFTSTGEINTDAINLIGIQNAGHYDAAIATHPLALIPREYLDSVRLVDAASTSLPASLGFYDNFKRANTSLGSLGTPPNNFSYDMRGTGGVVSATQTNIQNGAWVSNAGDVAYAIVSLPRNISRMGARISFAPGGDLASSNYGTAALIISPSDTTGTSAFLNNVGVHMTVTTVNWAIKYILNKVFYTVASGTFTTHLKTDGTQYSVEFTVDGQNLYYNIAGSTGTCSSYFFQNLAGSYATFEEFYVNSDVNSLVQINAIWANGGASYQTPTLPTFSLSGNSFNGASGALRVSSVLEPTAPNQILPAINSNASLDTGTGLLTATLTTPGSGYNNGTYPGVHLVNHGGTGYNAVATVVVSGGAITSITPTIYGVGYAVNDEFMLPVGFDGGTANNFLGTVASVGSSGAIPVSAYFQNFPVLYGITSTPSTLVAGMTWFNNSNGFNFYANLNTFNIGGTSDLGNIYPLTDLGYNLGASGTRWNTLFTNQIKMSNAINGIFITNPGGSGATLALANGESLSTVGAFGVTFNFTALTNVTFPTSGTLATTSGISSSYAPIASPTFTGTVTLPTSTSSLGALVLPPGTLLTTPVSGTIENGGANLYFTQSSGARQALATLGSSQSFTNKNLNDASNLMGGTFHYTSQTATYSISTSDHFVDCSGTFTATLPTASGVSGKTYVITNTGSGTITVATTSSQTINGSSTVSLAAHQSVSVHSDNSNWQEN